MRIMQRLILILSLGVFFVFGMAWNNQRMAVKLQKQWENKNVDTMLKKICRTGMISLRDYVVLRESLASKITIAEIKVEEYQKEQDLDGNFFYYLITWQELGEWLLAEEQYFFQTDSVIKITVDCMVQGQQIENTYYGKIEGKAGM